MKSYVQLGQDSHLNENLQAKKGGDFNGSMQITNKEYRNGYMPLRKRIWNNFTTSDVMCWLWLWLRDIHFTPSHSCLAD